MALVAVYLFVLSRTFGSCTFGSYTFEPCNKQSWASMRILPLSRSRFTLPPATLFHSALQTLPDFAKLPRKKIVYSNGRCNTHSSNVMTSMVHRARIGRRSQRIILPRANRRRVPQSNTSESSPVPVEVCPGGHGKAP